MDFKNKGDLVFLLGGTEDGGELAGSEYIELHRGIVAGRPAVDLDQEKRVQRCCLSLIQKGWINSAHDCSDGGLAVALAESCIAGGFGFIGESFTYRGRIDTALFGEGQSRIVVSVAPEKVEHLAHRYRFRAQHSCGRSWHGGRTEWRAAGSRRSNSHRVRRYRRTGAASGLAAGVRVRILAKRPTP